MYEASDSSEQFIVEFKGSKPCETSGKFAINTDIFNNKLMCFRLFKCFYEAGDNYMCSQFVKSFCLSDDCIDLMFVGITSTHYIMPPLSPSDVECLASFLACKQEWQKLSLSLSDVSFEFLHQLLTTNAPTIHEISLRLCSQSTSSSYFITDIILICKSTKLSVAGTFCIATLVNSLHFLKELSIEIEPCFKTTELLSEQSLEGLKHNSTLQRLKVYGHFSDEQYNMIGQKIKQLNRNIEVLIIHMN